MQYRRAILSVVLAVGIVAGWSVVARAAAKEIPTSQPGATTSPASRPVASQPVIPSDPQAIRGMILQMKGIDPIAAADAVVQLKLLAKRGVPVWDSLEAGDAASSRQLLTWLRDHPGNIHHPSPLRFQWESMEHLQRETQSDKTRMMGGAELIEYAKIAREMIRDGDPYGYYAMLDVARSVTYLLSREGDRVITPYVAPYLDNHLNQQMMAKYAAGWKGYWTKPLTEKRKVRSPLSEPDSDGTPAVPGTPWQLPARLQLAVLDAYQAYLNDLGLWQTPPWETKYTAQTGTAELLKAMAGASFPVRQHIWRLLWERMGDAEARDLVAQAIDQKHPSAQLLRMALDATPILQYADAIRQVWPKELAEQCPGTLEDVVSANPRRQYEGILVTQTTLLYWPDRTWANREAIRIFEAGGRGATEFSIAILMTVDNKEGVDKLLAVYRGPGVPDMAYNTLHRWLHNAAGPFKTACAEKDLAPLMIKLTTATQPAIDTSKKDWSQILRMAYDLAWWRLNSEKLYWNEKAGRLEVPADELTRPTEEQIVASYAGRSELLRGFMEAGKTRTMAIDPRKER